MKKTAKQIQKSLELDQTPDVEFMALLEAVGDGAVIEAPKPLKGLVKAASPKGLGQDFAEAVAAQKVGQLLEQARKQTGLTLAEVGEILGVSRSRVSQMESAENLEMASILRLASALGMEVELVLKPKQGQPLAARLLEARSK